MLQIEDLGLDPPTQNGLRLYQAEVDSASNYAEQVVVGKRLFENRNRASNPVFRVVRERLRAMCAGAQRCGYCEDSVGDEVEHILPKNLYPDRVFVWSNFLFACGRCNGSKSSRFAVLAGNNLVDVTRRRDEPVRRPRSGASALVNPREEDPMCFLDLEISGTFMFLPREGLAETEQKRACYTIDVLKLNRDVLLAARREAYASYRARLAEYREWKNNGASQRNLDQLARAITSSAHPSVFREMQRQHELIEELTVLFSSITEALLW